MCDGEVAKTWNPSGKQCSVAPVPLQLAQEGGDYVNTYRNVFGTISLISCLRERKNAKIVVGSEDKPELVLEIPPLPPESAVALFSMGFRVAIDPAKGFMPARLEHLESVNDQLVKRSSTEITDWRRLDSGIFVPTRAVFRFFDTMPDKGTFGELSGDAELSVDVAKSAWNVEIPDSQFELALPRGTAVTDLVNKARYIVGSPDPGKNLRELAADARDIVPLNTGPTKTQSHTRPFQSLFWSAGIVVLVLLAGFVYVRMRRARQ